MLLAGDFQQTLPIVPRVTQATKVNECVKVSYLWPFIRKLSLKKNMRVHLRGNVSIGEFSELLLKIGNRECPEGKVAIPAGLGSVLTTLADLTARIYPDIADISKKSMDCLCKHAILSPKNHRAAVINDTQLNSFEGAQ